jgi:hypothetical protein
MCSSDRIPLWNEIKFLQIINTVKLIKMKINQREHKIRDNKYDVI